MTNFINDGYTREVTLPATEFHSEPFTFEYRPMTQRERLRHIAEMEKIKDEVAKQEKAEVLMANRLKSWSEDAEITPDNVGRLEPHLSAEVYSIVCGFTPPPGEEKSDADSEGDRAGN